MERYGRLELEGSGILELGGKARLGIAFTLRIPPPPAMGVVLGSDSSHDTIIGGSAAGLGRCRLGRAEIWRVWEDEGGGVVEGVVVRIEGGLRPLRWRFRRFWN